MAKRALFLGQLAGVTQIIFGALLGGIASFGGEPGFLPRGMVLLALFALPGVIGLLGARASRPALLLAAALASFVGSFIAFSGVTLIFLVPAILFFFAAGFLAASARPVGAGAWLGGLGRLAAAGMIVALILGAGASALLVTDSACWNVYQTSDGTRVEVTPYVTGGIEVPSGATSTGCSTGVISFRGVGLGTLLGGTGVGLALLVARRRVPPVA